MPGGHLRRAYAEKCRMAACQRMERSPTLGSAWRIVRSRCSCGNQEELWGDGLRALYSCSGIQRLRQHCIDQMRSARKTQ
jgi:hypothetical protein